MESPDVFESDEPTTNPLEKVGAPVDTSAEQESIESSSNGDVVFEKLSMAQSASRFKNSILDSIETQRHHFTPTVIQARGAARETTVRKLRRLIAETGSLESEVKQAIEDGVDIDGLSASKLLEHVDLLNSDIDRISKLMIDTARGSSEKTVQKKQEKPVDALDSRADSRALVAIEKRISELELALGTSNMSKKSTGPTVVESIAELEREFRLVTRNTFSDKLHARCAELTKSFTTLLEKKSMADATTSSDTPDTGVRKQVSELYSVCRGMPESMQMLPQIVDRLNSLQAIHNDAADYATKLDLLQQENTQLRNDIDRLQSVCDKLDKTLQHNEQVVKQ